MQGLIIALMLKTCRHNKPNKCTANKWQTASDGALKTAGKECINYLIYFLLGMNLDYKVLLLP